MWAQRVNNYVETHHNAVVVFMGLKMATQGPCSRYMSKLSYTTFYIYLFVPLYWSCSQNFKVPRKF